MESVFHIKAEPVATPAEERSLPTPCSLTSNSPLDKDGEDVPALSRISWSKKSARLFDDGNEADTPTLQFVSFTHPSQLQETTMKQAVRSHVTRRQHQKKRRKSAQLHQSKDPNVPLRSRQREPNSIQQPCEKAEFSQDEVKRDLNLHSHLHQERRYSQDGSPNQEVSGMAPYSRLLEFTLQKNSRDSGADSMFPQASTSSKVFLVLNPSVSGTACVKGLHIDTRSILVSRTERDVLPHG